MDWFRFFFLCLMIIVQENNCNEVLYRFRREHQVDDSLKKNIKEKSVIIDQKIKRPDVLHQHEIEEPNVTAVPPLSLKNSEKKVATVSHEKQEQQIKASIQKLPPTHPLSRAIKMILDEKEQTESVDGNKSHGELKDYKDVDNIVKSDIQGKKIRNPVKEIKRDAKEKLVTSSHKTTLLQNSESTKDSEEYGHQVTPKVRSLKQKEEDTSESLEKSDKKDFQKKQNMPVTKTDETTDEKDKYIRTRFEHKCSNKPLEKDKTQTLEELMRHDLDSKTSIECEDTEYEETYSKKPQHFSDLPISQTPYDGAMNQLPYCNIPKPNAGNHYTQNFEPYPYSKVMIQEGTVSNSPNPNEQQWVDSFPDNISPYKYTYNSYPATNNFANNINNNDVIRRAWKNRVIRVDGAGIKDQGAVLSMLRPRSIGDWQRPQPYVNEINNIISDQKIQETNGNQIKEINADKHQRTIPSFFTYKQ